MTVKVYGAPCTSTRKVKEWLTKHGINYIERNIIRDPLTVSELQEILQRTMEGTDEIIAKKSKIYKDLDQDIDTLPLQQLLALIHERPGLLKNPIIMDEKRFLVGYHEDDIRQFLPRKIRNLQWMQWKMNYQLMPEG